MTPSLRQSLTADILRVLSKASHGKGIGPHALAAYQIFPALNAALRKALRSLYGAAMGKGAGRHYTAASAIAAIIRNHLKGQVVTRTVASARMRFVVSGAAAVPPGYPVTAVYSLP